MMGIDFEQFIEVFNTWAITAVPLEQKRWLAVDGKTINGSQTIDDKNYSSFVQVVSVFSTATGITLGMSSWVSTEKSEIVVVQNLIKALKLEGVVFTLDALHCQKKLRR
jgi:hypothetical protein